MDSEAASNLTTVKMVPIKSEEVAQYEKQIAGFRGGTVDETKMQKFRLQFGTYAQRQDGVQMQRIKIPGGNLNSQQLRILAEAADEYASGFIHFTTRQDAQLYYIQLERVPAMLELLGSANITTREACGNTVRNITACYRAGVAADEVFNVQPYASALTRYLLRNKFNQNLGRKVKFAFEGCADDHSVLSYHDLGFKAVTREESGVSRRGFRVTIGGGLGAAPYAAHLYTEFLPVEELFNLTVAVVRLFDRFGERKQRMKARMKFLVQSMGWDAFREALDEERERVGPIDALEQFLEPELNFPAEHQWTDAQSPQVLSEKYLRWACENVLPHKVPTYRGVHIRTSFGDLTSQQARLLSDIADRFSHSQVRVSVEQNLFLPWVPATALVELHAALEEAGLAAPGAESISDVTACPGADTCRLGIASAKGLGAALTEAFEGGQLASHRESYRDLRIKISGCPNGCAQHAVSAIGFHAAALSQGGRNVPTHILFLGGQASPAKAGKIVAKYPAKAVIPIVGELLSWHQSNAEKGEPFAQFLERVGEDEVRSRLEKYKTVPSFEEAPEYYDDFGHENEKFTVRSGVRGECAGSTIAEHVPVIAEAREKLSLAVAHNSHQHFEAALIDAYDAAAYGARVPLYARLLDPFTSEEALWEFENIFVISGKTEGAWQNLSAEFKALKEQEPGPDAASTAIEKARSFIDYCETIKA